MNSPQSQRPVVAFRVIHDSDSDFLYQLFASTRAHELELLDWTEEQKSDFLRSQFKAQSASFATAHLGAVHRIIHIGEEDIGRLIVDRQSQCLELIDLSLVPAWRGRGVGTDVLRALMNEAHGGKVPMRLYVLQNSPALNLYLRHGFRPIAERSHRYEMEWRPDTSPREI